MRDIASPLSGFGSPFGRRRRDTTVEPLDLFVIVGQSNAEGRGDSTQSPAAPGGVEISGSTIIAPLADPVGGAVTGSMWPAWSNEHFARTGRMSAFVEAATGGTSLIPDEAGTNWSPSGTLRASAVTAANNAIAAINAASNFELGAVRFVWSQGESESQSINGTTISGAIYKDALIALATYFKAQVPVMSEMLVVRTGRRRNEADLAGYAEIREAQDDACSESALLRMVYRGASGFGFDGRQLQDDQVHYNQAGLNETGRVAARYAALSGNAPVPDAPALLASGAWGDTDSSPNTSKTESHTTHVGCKSLVVAVGVVRTTSTTVNPINNVTFDGVSMRKCNSPPNTLLAGNARRVDIGVFYIDEPLFGGSLGGVTGNIVAAPNLNTNIISFAAFDLNARVMPEAATGDQISGLGASGGSVSSDLYAGAPCFAVGVVASGSDGAAALTHTLTGLTEVLDAGGSDGTRSGQVSIGHAAVGEVAAYDVGATFSDDVAAAAFTVAAFRGVLPGEDPTVILP